VVAVVSYLIGRMGLSFSEWGDALEEKHGDNNSTAISGAGHHLLKIGVAISWIVGAIIFITIAGALLFLGIAIYDWLFGPF